jgi:hypothetical protein
LGSSGGGVLPKSFCANCGRDLPEGALFCDGCGSSRTDFSFPFQIGDYIRDRWIRWGSVPEKTDLNPENVLTHDVANPFLLRQQYSSQGWNTAVIMQDVTHGGPTTAIAIGYPVAWPNAMSDLSKWGNEVILRLHVDVCKFGGKLVSQPHVEPDPEYNPKEHMDMWSSKNEIRGPLAVQMLQEFFKN